MRPAPPLTTRPRALTHSAGIPPLGYGQDYYTLRSIFMDRVPPPEIHMHLRKFAVRAVPIGDLSGANARALPSGGSSSGTGGGAGQEAVETDIPPAERDAFDLWLRTLWRTKDGDMERFLRDGAFVQDPAARIAVPVAVRRRRDVLDAFCFFVPALLGWLLAKLK